jgi:hypothetical protein
MRRYQWIGNDADWRGSHHITLTGTDGEGDHASRRHVVHEIHGHRRVEHRVAL